MALIVEDGNGLATADSYLSVADADTYHAQHGASATWTAASTPSKEQGLRLATQYLDIVYLRRWNGTRAHETQALAWPRTDVLNYDGFEVDDASLPGAIQDATAELALRSLTETLIPDIAAGDNGYVSAYSVTVGPISESTSYGSGGRSTIKRFRMIELMLRDLIRDFSNVERA